MTIFFMSESPDIGLSKCKMIDSKEFFKIIFETFHGTKGLPDATCKESRTKPY
jgi:hypothetical protein